LRATSISFGNWMLVAATPIAASVDQRRADHDRAHILFREASTAWSIATRVAFSAAARRGVLVERRLARLAIVVGADRRSTRWSGSMSCRSRAVR
jgi:hypothetical protein